LYYIAQDRAARGWAEVSTTSASIRWIWPSYTYLDELSQVVVYWMKSHYMLGCGMSMGWWKYNWQYDEYVIGSSLPFLLFVVCYVVWLFLLRWSSIWLMGADGRGSRGQQGNGDSAA